MKITTLAEVPTQGVSHDPEIQKRVMLRNDDLPHLTNFSQARFVPGQQVTPHKHVDMSEVFLVESGEGTIWINHVAYPLIAGTCVAVEAGELHKLANTGQTDLVLTYFGILV